MKAKDRIAIVIALLSLVAGSGWGKYWLERRHESRVAEQEVLTEFLEPLEFTLNQNKQVHAALTRDPLLRRLEGAPDYLQQHFASLPDTSSVKLMWSAMIEGLMDRNRHAVTLIRDNVGHMLRDDFRRACNDFVYHAERWEEMWRAVLADTAVPQSLVGRDRLLTPAFPESMDVLLAREIEERRHRAGL
jgi:hypothetical protein